MWEDLATPSPAPMPSKSTEVQEVRQTKSFPQDVQDTCQSLARVCQGCKHEPASSSSDEYFYSTSKDLKISMVNVKFNNVLTEIIMDTGASTDILDEYYYFLVCFYRILAKALVITLYF